MYRLLSLLLVCLTAAALCACRRGPGAADKGDNGAFSKASHTESPNAERIRTSGELIIGTMSGPDTYFDYQGRAMGVQYSLAENFATAEGVGVRVELANDTLSLISKLKSGETDLVAMQLPDDFIKRQGLLPAGASDTARHTSWAVAADHADLARLLDDWYDETVWREAETRQHNWQKARTQVRRTVRAPYISRAKGIISTYDPYFKEVAGRIGWDWRLVAAQCYQESGFDPNAVSWAGACGLMQLMPATAARYGLSKDKIFAPVENIRTSSRFILDLQSAFADIADPQERVCFVLAAYNGGLGHVRDAQALARKYGRDAHRWSETAPFILRLSQVRYYRDPVVKYGYMIGQETFTYVESVMQRWRGYGGDARLLSLPGAAAASGAAGAVRNGGTLKPHKRNRFSSEHRILSAEELGRE